MPFRLIILSQNDVVLLKIRPPTPTTDHRTCLHTRCRTRCPEAKNLCLCTQKVTPKICSSLDVRALMEPVLTTLGVIHVPMVAHCLMAALRSHGVLGGDDRAIESERSRCLECPKFPEPYCGADVLRKP
ncbi:hypothetical protein CXB51_029841 [Gossypium anomalum]|uniref:Uncharacterized protein n=1 Tax=Gossypium anomalum TaxID=47600 RepID=A0A8J5YFY3_9ROSI|nr:hypothetical protein CXB51_029841 [Gossypium anomalum]